MLVGSARLSTRGRDLALQLDALAAAGCERAFTGRASGARRARPRLRAGLDDRRPGDTPVVGRLDRPARSLQQLIATVAALGGPSTGCGAGDAGGRRCRR